MDAAAEKKHLRYLIQSKWSGEFRKYLYRKLPKDRSVSILEVGSGTGALLQCIESEFTGKIGLLAGVDIDLNVLHYAKNITSGKLFRADGMMLPFTDQVFDFVFCHYLLLWTNSPESVIKEMKRVTKSGGLCAAMAEPDYDEMTAEPESLRKLAQLQAKKLNEQGADLNIGHCLREIFLNAGFCNCQFGCYQKQTMERKFLVQEIAQMTADSGASSIVLDENTNYAYHVPTYYAYAVK